MKNLIKFLAFLLILGPVPNSPIGALFDTIQIISLSIIVFFFILKRTLIINDEVKILFKLIVFFGVYIIVVGFPKSLLFDNNSDLNSEYFNTIIRPFRILINFLGVSGLVTLYRQEFGDGRFLEQICKDIVDIVVLNGIFMLLQLYVPSGNAFLSQILYNNIDPVHFQIEYRVGGLYLSGGAIPSMYQAFPLLIIPYLVRQRVLRVIKALLYSLILIVSIIITGRTGLLLIPFSLLIIIQEASFFKRILVFLFVCLLITFLPSLLIQMQEGVVNTGNEMLIFNYERLLRLFDLSSGSVGGDQTVSVILNKFSLSDKLSNLLFGDVNFSNYQNRNVSDMGYNIILYKYGLFGFLFYYAPVIYMTAKVWRDKTPSLQNFFFLKIILIVYLLLELKEEVIYARNGFSIILLIVVGFFVQRKAFDIKLIKNSSSKFSYL